MSNARVVVVGNEKGGAGKSTIAIHLTTALAWQDARVAVIDLDLRQQSLGHFLASRRAWLAASDATAPLPDEYRLADKPAAFAAESADAGVARFAEILGQARETADYIVIDTPGGDTALSRAAHAATRPSPGSDTTGVPASVTSAKSWPASRWVTSSRSFAGPPCAW